MNRFCLARQRGLLLLASAEEIERVHEWIPASIGWSNFQNGGSGECGLKSAGFDSCESRAERNNGVDCAADLGLSPLPLSNFTEVETFRSGELHVPYISHTAVQ